MNDGIIATLIVVGVPVAIMGIIIESHRYMVGKVIRAGKRIISANKNLVPLSVGLFITGDESHFWVTNRYPGVVFSNGRYLEAEYLKDDFRMGGKVNGIISKTIQSKRHKDEFWYIHMMVDGVRLEFLPMETGWLACNKKISDQTLKMILQKLGRSG